MMVSYAMLVLWIFSISHNSFASTVYQAAGISRHHEGDTFLLRRDGVAVTCSSTLCADSRATPAMMPALATGTQQCACRCPPELPVFREDLHVCVDDIHECSLATFKNGAKIQKVPFVFLPMKGQIIHPSSDIIFSDDAGEEPICVVSHAQFLTRSGWLELRNTSDTEPPLRLFRDQRRTFLQWLGEQDLRLGMEGRVLLARLMCKDPNDYEAIPSSTTNTDPVPHTFSTPCVAFRVAGVQGAGEVVFTSDYTMAGSGSLLHGLLNTDHRNSHGLSTSEGVAVGICVLLLGLVYAASVCVYIYVRRRRKRRKKRGDHDDSSDSERGGHMGLSNGDLDILGGGVVKNNPLLMSNREHFLSRGTASGFMHNSRRSLRGNFCEESPNQGTSEEDEEAGPETSEHSDQSEDRNTQIHKTTNIKAMVHPECGSPHSSKNNSPTGGRNNRHNINNENGSSGLYTLTLQPAAEGGSMERHPEESVSIVETLDEAAPFSRSRDFSFLGGRHTMGASSMGLPGCTNDGSSGSRGGSSSSASHNGPFLAAPGTATRRKLYFNPAYFDPEMLQSPPPAALEFLSKLREVITMSKHKMASKRFSPSLLGIPEEQDSVISSRTSKSLQGYTNTKRSWTGSHPVRTTEPGKSCSILPDTDDVTGSKQQTIRRWLEDLESGDPVEEEEIENNNDTDSTPQISLPHEESSSSGTSGTPPPKKLMDAVIKELVRERGLAPGETSSSDETVNQIKTNAIRKISADNDYELVSMQHSDSPQPPTTPSAPNSPIARPPLMMYCLPELLAKTTGYNLVSEVYVNDGYSCSSNQSSTSDNSVKKQKTVKHRKPKGSVESSEPSSHSSSQSDNHDEMMVADDPEISNYPGSLTIKLSDPPAHQYREVRNDETEGFEPDTLDRIKRIREVKHHEDICADSLERPMKILLKSSGSFYTDAIMNENLNQPIWGSPKDIWQRIDYNDRKKRSPSSIADLRSTNISFATPLNRNKEFGSLREIFEAKRQQQLQKHLQDMLSMPAAQQNVNNLNIINNNNNNSGKRGTTRSLIEPNELKFRYGLNPQMIDEIRDLMWRSTPEAVNPLPRLPANKPKRQRSADITSSPPTPPPPIPPLSNPPSLPTASPPSLSPSLPSSEPPSLPPKQRNKIQRPQQHPPLPPRETKPPPSLPPKNLRGSRSPRLLPNLVTSHKVPASGASAGSDYDEDDNIEEGSCTLGRKVETCLNDAFSSWGKQRNKIWDNEVKISHRPGDSGYLSSDSNNSLKRESPCRAVEDEEGKIESSETEESLCDGGSESGAESIGTDSFFFGRVRPQELSSSSPEMRRESSHHVSNVIPVLINAGKKKPPPPPKRGNSKLENKLLLLSSSSTDTIIKNVHSKYGL